jgi:transcriptional regulator with XRE-family HTH domain
MSCMLLSMTTENVISGDYPDEPLPQAVARRLRGQLAEHRMTLDDLGRVLGISRMGASRRVNGLTPVTLAELEIIDAMTPITATYLLTGHHPLATPPPPPSHPSEAPQTAGAPIRRLRRRTSTAGGRAKRDDRRLAGVQADEVDEVDDAAIAYLRLADPANDPLCPHQGSNLGPADYQTACAA